MPKPMRMKPRFLVAYDYGQGGSWGYVRAESAAQIIELFPEVMVVDEVPSWMDEDFSARLIREEEDVENPGKGLLGTILAYRGRDG